LVESVQRQLVQRAQTGDHEAFSALVTASYPRAYRVAKLILSDEDRTQDAVQEAMVAAWRDIRALREPDAWDAWLHRLVVRACYRSAGRSRRHALVELNGVRRGELISRGDHVAAIADRDQVGTALERLPIDQRVVIVLHFYADLPLTEVAVSLGIPSGTAKSRLHRGLEALRRVMVRDRPEGRGTEEPSR
jgi:RNA polymerase sigma-70 factor (ECF subfamily)